MKNKIYLYLYYALLILVFASRKDATSEPFIAFRLVFLMAVIAPCIAKKRISYPAILALFYPMTVYGFAYSYMPYTISIYLVITIALFFFLRKRQQKKEKTPVYLIAFTVYIFFIDLITSIGQGGVAPIQSVAICFLLVILLIGCVGENNISVSEQFSVCLSVMSIVLCYVFLSNRNLYIFQTFGEDHLERTGWTDPNYFGMVLGMGAIAGMVQLSIKGWKSLPALNIILYVSAIVLVVPVLALNASRGAVLSLVLASLVLLLFSKTKTVYKVLIVILAALFIVYLYTNQYFELLEYRMQNDDGTGSDRTNIWLSKLEAYTNGNILNQLFGYGHHGGVFITGKNDGFHNDFLAFLVCYGPIGFLMLLYALYYPIKLVAKSIKQRTCVAALIVYIGTCFLTLEPFSSGFFAYFLFYVYILVMARSLKEQELSKKYSTKDNITFSNL